jgi:predicted RNA-binding protein with PUA domain
VSPELLYACPDCDAPVTREGCHVCGWAPDDYTDAALPEPDLDLDDIDADED